MTTELNKTVFDEEPVDQVDAIRHGTTINGKHPKLLINLIEQHLERDAESIVDMELCLADFTPARIGGALNEYIHSPRLDNLTSCFTSIKERIYQT